MLYARPNLNLLDSTANTHCFLFFRLSFFFLLLAFRTAFQIKTNLLLPRECCPRFILIRILAKSIYRIQLKVLAFISSLARFITQTLFLDIAITTITASQVNTISAILFHYSAPPFSVGWSYLAFISFNFASASV